MRIKKPRKKLKIMIPFIGILCSIGSFAIGFSMWTVNGGDKIQTSGDVGADNVVPSLNPVDCIDNLSLNGFDYAPKYGFCEDGIFGNSSSVSGSGYFNVNTAFDIIDSLAFKGKITFTVTLSSSAFSSYFVSDGIVLTEGFTSSSGNLSFDTASSGFTHTFTFQNIVVDKNSASYVSAIYFEFEINLSFTGSGATLGNSGNFPSFAGDNKLSLSIVPGEAS